ncbi:MAG TPA: hypothetical protein VI893_02750, partial [Thermoplasmata archaeon]|nr:hypothetical protein [Thermoplasmata archaeon]
KDLQGILAEDLPYLVMYFRDSIEAFRKDRFIIPVTDPPTWIKGTAGVNNAWNWMLVQPAGKPATLTAKYPGVMACERSYQVTVSLLSGTMPLEGAVIAAQATAPLRFVGGAAAATAVTDENGQASFQVLATRVPGQVDGWVNLSSSKEGYYPVYRDLAIQVICDGPMPPVGELSVSPLQIGSGGSARVLVRVESLADASPIEGARVVLDPPAMGSLDKFELLTDVNGEATTTFRLASTMKVDSATIVTLRGVPSATVGGVDLEGPAFETDLWAVPGPPPCDGCNGKTDPTPLVAAGVALAVGSVATVFAARWLLKRKR